MAKCLANKVSVGISLGSSVMDTLFAPWRMEFIEKHDESKGCALCLIIQTKALSEKQVIAEGKRAFIVLNKYPYTHGHIMVVPKRHESQWTELSGEEMQEIGELTQKSLKVLEKSFHPQGFNIGVNLGKAAGAGITGHVHQHIVPRWMGDFNFMPLLGKTKVISEHLDMTFHRLREAWGAV